MGEELVVLCGEFVFFGVECVVLGFWDWGCFSLL